MLTEALYSMRRRLPDLLRLLGSWQLSVVLIVLAGLYNGLLAIWSTSSPPHVVQSIAGLLPFWLVWIGLLVNTGLCLWRRWPVLVRQTAQGPMLVNGRARFECGGWSEARARTFLARSGFKVIREGDGRLWGLRRRWGEFGTYLFHASFFLVALAALLTSVSREESRIWVAEGEYYRGADEQILSRSAPRLVSGEHFSKPFTVRSIEPEFWQGQLLFTRLEARLEFVEGEEEITRINRPLCFGWGTFLRLSGFGYAPRYEVIGSDGTALDSAFVKMNLFPPGQEDFFKAKGYPHRFYVEMLPDAVRRDGRIVNRSLDLRRPAVALRIQRGKLDLVSQRLFLGDPVAFEGLTLRFPEVAYWGEFTIVRDPGIPVLFVSFAIALLALVVRLGGLRAEVEWRPGLPGHSGRLVGWGSVEEPAESRSGDEVGA